ncbi:MAG: heparinase II/III domain-containing protein [Kiritimatiellia bacterium]|jgi:hypothetical protein
MKVALLDCNRLARGCVRLGCLLAAAGGVWARLFVVLGSACLFAAGCQCHAEQCPSPDAVACPPTAVFQPDNVEVEISLRLTDAEKTRLKNALFDRDLSSLFYKKYDAGSPIVLDFKFKNAVQVNEIRISIQDTTRFRAREGFARWKTMRFTLNGDAPIERVFINAEGPQQIAFPAVMATNISIAFVETWNVTNRGFAINEIEFLNADTKADAVIPEAIGFNYPVEHPTLFLHHDDIAAARQRVEKYDWARQLYREYQKTAEKWLDISDADIVKMMPATNAVFIWGLDYLLCPLCGERLHAVGFEDPHQVVCKNRHKFPDAEHPDDGQGWFNPDTGKRHCFLGVYNSSCVKKLMDSVLKSLCYMYVLSGEEKYAHKAALILDCIASLDPACDGPVDYPGGGRMQASQYQVAFCLSSHYAPAYDILCMSESFSGPSRDSRYTTIEEHVRHELLLKSADYCMALLNSGQYRFTNGGLDLAMGVMSVGSTLGIKYYVDHLLRLSPYALPNFFANTFDRDGCYYETSGMYESHTRELWEMIATICVNLRNPDYPRGYNFYAHPVYRKGILGGESKYLCSGHFPHFGDHTIDRAIIRNPPPFNRRDFINAVKFYVYDPDNASQYRQILDGYTGGDVVGAYEADDWLLFHAPDFTSNPPPETPDRNPSALFGCNGLVLLRAGPRTNESSVFFRYGPTLNHGHLDELAFLFYGLGRELSLETGGGANHFRYGWAGHTIAHNTVAVNGKSQLEDAGGGGSLNYFFASPGFSVAEAHDETAYQAEDISLYRRNLALVDINDSDVYLVDIFDVGGGRQRDYSFHSIEGDFSTTGLAMGEIVRAGSMAGPDIRYGDAIMADYRVKGWTPESKYQRGPPGAGYGFLIDYAQAEGNCLWSARWSACDEYYPANVELTMLPAAGRSIFVADGPLSPPPTKTKFVIARDQGDGVSRFFSVIHFYEREPAVLQVGELTVVPVSAGGPSAESDPDPCGAVLSVNTVAADETRPDKNNLMIYEFIKAPVKESLGLNTERDALYNSLMIASALKGNSIAFEFETPESAEYDLAFKFLRTRHFGEWQAFIDDQPVGSVFDGKSATSTFEYATVPVGNIHLSAGKHLLRFCLTADGGMGLVEMYLDNKSGGLPAANTPRPAEKRLDYIARAGNPAVAHLLREGDRSLGSFSGEYFFCSVKDGQLLKMRLFNGTEADFGGWKIKAIAPQPFQGEIAAIDYARNEMTLSGRLPEFSGCDRIHFNAGAYSHGSLYHINQIQPIAGEDKATVTVREPSFFIADGKVAGLVSNNTIKTWYFLPYSLGPLDLQNRDNDYFKNKMILNSCNGRATHINKVRHEYIIQVDDNDGFAVGDSFQICDLQAGDSYFVPVMLALDLCEDAGEEMLYRLETPYAIEIVLPFPVSKVAVYDENRNLRGELADNDIAVGPDKSRLTISAQLLRGAGHVFIRAWKGPGMSG